MDISLIEIAHSDVLFKTGTLSGWMVWKKSYLLITRWPSHLSKKSEKKKRNSCWPHWMVVFGTNCNRVHDTVAWQGSLMKRNWDWLFGIANATESLAWRMTRMTLLKCCGSMIDRKTITIKHLHRLVMNRLTQAFLAFLQQCHAFSRWEVSQLQRKTLTVSGVSCVMQGLKRWVVCDLVEASLLSASIGSLPGWNNKTTICEFHAFQSSCRKNLTKNCK